MLNYLLNKEAVIIEVDTMEILIAMVETNQAKSVLPMKTILSRLLVIDTTIRCGPVTLYVYKLFSNSSQIRIELDV